MNPNEKRSMILRILRNTFIRIAERDDTVSEQLLLREICQVHGVSLKTAKSYINELIDMGMVNRDKELGYLWHKEEKEIKLKYLEEKAENDKIPKGS